jgi:propionyl-CoA carboxylase beta chain
MGKIIEHIVDDGEFLPVHPMFAPNIMCGFARVDGMPIGIVANQPTQMAGCLDIDASEKAARFVRTCDAFSVPILTLVDVPGFLPGTVMGSKHLGADVNLAWPTGQIAVMGAQGAVNILYRRDLQKAAAAGEDVEARRADLVTEYQNHLANPYVAAERGYIDNVITPSSTRAEITRALRGLRTKRAVLPAKKHGNIPL